MTPDGARYRGPLLRIALGFVVLLTGLLAAAPPRPALAHVPETVGPFATEVGWLHEPAVQGQMNGLDIRILTRSADRPVSGAQRTLKAVVSFGGQSRTLALAPEFGRAGAYTAPLLPTRPGAYTVRLEGTVNGTPFDATYDLGGDSDSVVVPLSRMAFPAGPVPAAGTRAAPGAGSVTGLAAASGPSTATATATARPAPARTTPAAPAWMVWLSLAASLCALACGALAWRTAARAAAR